MRFLGVVSDTHGLLRPGVLSALEGAEAIIHAGDIGDLKVLEQLESVAPVTAVRGRWCEETRFPELATTEALEFQGLWIYVLHDRDDLDLNPDGVFNMVVFGHTHQSSVEQVGSVLYLNPGSCGPRRASLPVSIARVSVDEGKLQAEIIPIDD